VRHAAGIAFVQLRRCGFGVFGGINSPQMGAESERRGVAEWRLRHETHLPERSEQLNAMYQGTQDS
jgi:hypothetical protein